MLKRIRTHWLLSLVVLITCASWLVPSAQAAELLVGASTVSITPDRPIALQGQLATRISVGVESPVTATALAIESRDKQGARDQAILVSCDLAYIPVAVLAKVREALSKRLSDFPLEKLSLSATHTHTAPTLEEGFYEIPSQGVMRPTEYVEFFVKRVGDAIVQAWESRRVGKMGWGLGHAIVAHNRRAVWADGTAEMYGDTRRRDFRMVEGYEDHTLDVLFVWDAGDKLLATAINVPCPAQEHEAGMAINADYCHQVRESLRAKHGKALNVLYWCGAGGDQSPHLIFRSAAEDRMRKLRGLDRLQEIAQRIVQGWEEAYDGARTEMHADVAFAHRVTQLDLPRRIVTEREWQNAKAKAEEYAKQKGMKTMSVWHDRVVKRYEQQQAGTLEPYPMEMHVLRIGDVAIVTNAFEIFTDFGIQLKARSPALQTFFIQLAGPGNYLPSPRAVPAGGYSAIAESNEVGPEAGQICVDRAVEQLKELWKKKTQ